MVVSRKSGTPSTEQAEESIRIDLANPEDPDLLVLGFQELDLSTEALIYSTGTLREDAWCLAVLAALGEKAVNYEKANLVHFYCLHSSTDCASL